VITNLKFLRPFLLEGHLEAAGLIDRREMSDLLTEQQLVRAVQSLPALLSCLIAEGWLRTAGSAPVRQWPDDAVRPSHQQQRQHVATELGYHRFDN